MNRILTFTTFATLCLSGAAFAQQTTQSGILGPSDDATYTLRVQGSNGVLYNCKDEIIDVNGAPSRECVRAGEAGSGSVFGSGTAGLAGGGVAAGVVGLVVLAAAVGGGSSSTTTTSN